MDNATRTELDAIKQRQSDGYDEASRCDAFKAALLMLKDVRRCITIIDEQGREIAQLKVCDVCERDAFRRLCKQHIDP